MCPDFFPFVFTCSAKTLMFVNISPADYNSEETYTSLQYAQRVKATIKIAEYAKKFKEGGATILGGCCETRPSHIREIAKLK